MQRRRTLVRVADEWTLVNELRLFEFIEDKASCREIRRSTTLLRSVTA